MEKLDPGTKREENGSVRFYTGRGGRKCFHKGPHSKYFGLCGSLLQCLNSGDQKQPEKVHKGVGVAVSLQNMGQAGHGLGLAPRLALLLQPTGHLRPPCSRPINPQMEEFLESSAERQKSKRTTSSPVPSYPKDV